MNSRPGPPRRTLLLGALAAAGCAGPVRQSVAPTTSAPPSVSTSPTPQASAVPPPEPVPVQPPPLPSRDGIIERYAGRTPREWGTEVTGVISTLGDAGVPSSPAPRVALTFDACGGGGGGDGYDAELIDLLRAEHVAATLYLNARWIRANPSLAAELAADPLFLVASHGNAHVPLSVTGRDAYGIVGTGSVGAAYDELTGTVDWFLEHLGHSPTSFRPGTAHCDEIGAAIAAELGMPVAGFSVNGDGGATYSAAMVETALLDVADGDIVLAHMNRPSGGTAQGCARALPTLLDRGVRFVTLDPTSG